MEQNKLLSSELNISSEQSSTLTRYASLIHRENLKYNLTGHKTLEEILKNLIVESIQPVSELIVPRGTIFADLGTGAGIPGIPLAVFFGNSQGILFDSNSKKIRFIDSAAKECGIDNIKTVNCRIEEAGRKDEYREFFDWVFSRAMADIYTACELGAPLLKKGGKLFLYSKEKEEILNPGFISHLDNLGLEPAPGESPDNGKENVHSIDSTGILLIKAKPCPARYPRRIAVIRRESERI